MNKTVLNKFHSLFFPNDHKAYHIKSLDGLRGVAVLLVMFSHTSNAHLHLFGVFNFMETGKIGVYLFFVLSAYLLDNQIALALQQGKTSYRYWLNYLFRRFLRIFPLFIISLGLHLFATKIIGITTCIPDTATFINHLFLLEGESIFWSIPVEFKYYLLSPFIMIFCHRVLKWRPKLVIPFITILIFLSIFVAFYLPLSKVSTINYLSLFLVGTLLSIYSANLTKYLKYDRLLEILGFVSLFFIILCFPKVFESLTGHYLKTYSLEFRLPLALCWGGILLATLKERGYIKNFFEFPPLRFIGVISFSVYLFHTTILNIVHHSNILGLPEWMHIYAFFGLTFLVCSITYLLIEKPLSKIKLYNISHGTRTNQPKVYTR